MRFSQSKLDKQANRQEASNYRGLSKLGRKQHLATKPVSRRRPMEIKLPFLGAYRPFSPTEATRPKRVEDPRPSRVRLSTSNLSQKMRNDKEHRCEIAQK